MNPSLNDVDLYKLTFTQQDSTKKYPHGWGFAPPIIAFPKGTDAGDVQKYCTENYTNEEFACIGAMPLANPEYVEKMK